MNKNYWIYKLNDGFEVISGKTDLDNDILSLKIASPQNYWFHISGAPGSHTLLRHEKNKIPCHKILKQAASIAAWHSRAKKNCLVNVTYTLAKNISKPKGAEAGSVTVKRAKNIKVISEIPKD